MRAEQKCYECCIQKAMSLLINSTYTQNEKYEIISQLKEYLIETKKEISAPELMAEEMIFMKQYVDTNETYHNAKIKYNDLLLKREEDIVRKSLEAEEPVLQALKYALTGNYIDFGALSDVNEEKLEELLADVSNQTVDDKMFYYFLKELQRSNTLVYITDNAGEIVLDKVFIRVLREKYPALHITVMVRGDDILNDATTEDAYYIGLNMYADVISNGTAIPGTPIWKIDANARNEIMQVDMCIAKGQGNFESLSGSGLNIFYLFLCKCDMFVERFGVEKYTSILRREL